MLNNWTCSTPSSTAITAQGFAVAPRNTKFTQRAVTVSRETSNPKEEGMGSSPPVLHGDTAQICAWTVDKQDGNAQTELDFILREIRRIIKANKTGSGDIDQIDLLPGGKPRNDLKANSNILAEYVRVKIWFIES